MPRHDFICQSCRAIEYNRIVPLDSVRSQSCRKCAGLLSVLWTEAPGIHFEGGGWAADDKYGRELRAKQRECNREWAADNERQYVQGVTRAYEEAAPPTDADLIAAESIIKQREARGRGQDGRSTAAS